MMAQYDDLYSALRKADAAGDVAGATRLAQYIKTLPVAGTAALEVVAEAKPEPSWIERATLGNPMVKVGRDLLTGQGLAGAVRGAGSIGATLMRPFESGSENEARRESMTGALQSLGADPESGVYQAGKLGAEMAGTAGIGGVAGLGARALGFAPRVVSALTTSGMATGAAPVGFAARAGDLALRSGAGAAVGGTSAGLLDPGSAGMGAAIGGVLPGALQAVGAGGKWAGNALWDMLTPDAQKYAVRLAQSTGKPMNEIVSALMGTKSEIPGSKFTVPQILQDPTISQVGRTVQNSGNFDLVNREAQNNLARIAAVERVAPTAGTVNDARANLGNAVVTAAKAGEAAGSRKVRNLFDAIPQDEVQMHLPIDQMQAAKNKYLGRGSFGSGIAPADQALNTARAIGTTTLDALKAAPVEKSQSLYDAVLSYGRINKSSPSAKMLLGELKDLQASKQGAAVMANNGKSVDQVAQAMHERGFIPDEDPATLIAYLKDAGRETFATDANVAGQYARRAEAQMGDLPGAEVLSKAVPFNEIQNLRSSIGEEAYKSKVAGNKQAAAALNEMKAAIDQKIEAVANGGAQAGEAFSPEAVNLYRKALAAHAAKKAQFNTGPQAAIFRMGADGLPVKEGAEVAPLFWNSGNAQIENLQAFKRLTKDDKGLVRLMKSNAMTELLDQAGKGTKGPLTPEGTLTAAGVDKWMRNHAGAAKELFTPQELAVLKAVQSETGRAGAAENLGRASGSNTAQNLQSILNLGLLSNPGLQSVANRIPFGKYTTGPAVAFMRGVGEKSRNDTLARLLADPEEMAKALQLSGGRSAKSNALAKLLADIKPGQAIARTVPVISAQ